MCFEWKWVVIHRDHYSAYRWEECENRISTLEKHSGRYLAPWNNAMVFNEESCTPENDERQPNLMEEHTTPNPEIGTQVVSRFAPFSRRLFGRIFGLFYDTRSLIFSTFEAVRNIMVRSSYRRGGRGSSMEDERNLRMWV
ncbi:uncharacterized protein LOC125664183 [Ostrea edulis]|uniref:uncharacterized protein LOC125664183 n=1 Tax=Ostrea edulis TaxID=37623 RepID=UPI0024AFD855|nr:uncharacterized protein LOC125664183 [Ostrea edulis]